MIEIRHITKQDIGEIVKIHRKAFDGFFLTLMGPAFLTKYYKTVLIHSGHIALLAENKDGIAGFAVGFVKPNEFYESIRSRKMSFGLAALPGLIRKPRLLKKMLANKDRAIELAASYLEPDRLLCELASIAVDPGKAGMGIGKILARGFIDCAREMNTDEVYLSTDADNNDKVNAFYMSLGFQLVDKITAPGNRLMNKWVFILKKREK